jgi:hypothetical protein
MSETSSVESVSGDVRSGTPTDPRIELVAEALKEVWRVAEAKRGRGVQPNNNPIWLTAAAAALAAVDVGDTLEQVGVEYRYVRDGKPQSPWQLEREEPDVSRMAGMWAVDSRPVFVRVVSTTPNKEDAS